MVIFITRQRRTGTKCCRNAGCLLRLRRRGAECRERRVMMWRWRPLLPALLAAGVLAGCGGGTPAPPSPDPYSARIGADRQAPASGIAGDRRRARHDGEGAALDESRGQPIGSIVPPESTQQQQQQSPPPPPASSQL
jgi:hypothetical protein